MDLWRRIFGSSPPAALSESPPPAPSRCLLRLLRSLAPADDEPRPELLLLGPPRGPQIEFFTHRGFRVTVEDLADFLEWARHEDPEEAGEPPTVIAQPAGRFHAAILFDVLDRLNDAAARLLLARLAEALHSRGYLFLLSEGRPQEGPTPPREVVFRGEGFLLEERAGRSFRRRQRANRDLMRLVAGFSIQQVQLRSDGVREMLLRSRAS